MEVYDMTDVDVVLKNGHIMHFRFDTFSVDTFSGNVKDDFSVLFLIQKVSNIALASGFLFSAVNCKHIELCCIGPDAENLHDQCTTRIWPTKRWEHSWTNWSRGNWCGNRWNWILQRRSVYKRSGVCGISWVERTLNKNGVPL